MFVMTPHHLNNLKRHRIKQQINRKIRASESTTLNWGKNIFLAEFFLFLLFSFSSDNHGTTIRVGTTYKKFLAVRATQLAGGVLLKCRNILKLCETFLKSSAGKKYRISIGLCK